MAPPPRHLLLPPVSAALDAWVADPDAGREALLAAVRTLADRMGVEIGHLRIGAPPLPELDAPLRDIEAADGALRPPDGSDPLGTIRVAGDPDAAAELAQGLGLLVGDARARVGSPGTELEFAL